jgi:glucokinase
VDEASSVLTAGLDLGGTKVLGVVADAAGRVMAEHRSPTPPGPDAALSEMAAVLDQLRAAVPDVAAVGAGVPGLVDLDGVLRYAPNLPGFEGVEVRAALETASELPVTVDNDANAAALAEVLHGAARGRSEVLLVTLGTGIGGGIITGGRLYRGAHGFAAEIGHITVDPDGPRCACGARGHWEALASGTALGRLGREWAARGEAPGVLARAGGRVEAILGYHVGAAAVAGEPDGLALLRAHARAVATGLGGLVNLLDPEVVVIGGGLVELGDVLLEPIREELPAFVEASAHRAPPLVVAAELGEHAGAVGAAALARALVPSRTLEPGEHLRGTPPYTRETTAR